MIAVLAVVVASGLVTSWRVYERDWLGAGFFLVLVERFSK